MHWIYWHQSGKSRNRTLRFNPSLVFKTSSRPSRDLPPGFYSGSKYLNAGDSRSFLIAFWCSPSVSGVPPDLSLSCLSSFLSTASDRSRPSFLFLSFDILSPRMRFWSVYCRVPTYDSIIAWLWLAVKLYAYLPFFFLHIRHLLYCHVGPLGESIHSDHLWKWNLNMS